MKMETEPTEVKKKTFQRNYVYARRKNPPLLYALSVSIQYTLFEQKLQKFFASFFLNCAKKHKHTHSFTVRPKKSTQTKL